MLKIWDNCIKFSKENRKFINYKDSYTYTSNITKRKYEQIIYRKNRLQTI